MINQIHIEGTTYCNGKCYFCPHHKVKRDGYLPYEILTSIVDQGMDLGCNNFCPFRLNEPFLFPDIFKWLDYLKQKKTTVDIFTNASVLDKDKADRLTEYSDIINGLVFSCHGHNPEIYAKTMGLDFYKTRNNILYFMQLKPKFYTEIYMLYPEQQITDGLIDSFNSLWEDMGFSSIQVKGFMNWAGSVNLPTRFLESKKAGMEIQRIPCARLVDQVDVDCNGNVVLCCLDAFSQEIFGNLKEQPLKNILESENRLKYIKYHNEGEFDKIPLCYNCSANII